MLTKHSQTVMIRLAIKTISVIYYKFYGLPAATRFYQHLSTSQEVLHQGTIAVQGCPLYEYHIKDVSL